MYSDPTGHFWHIVGGALIGAGISAIIDVGSQMLIERKSFKSIDWKSVGVSALEGAVSGGLAAATGGASLAASAGKGVAKATGKQIIKKAVKTAVVEGVAGAAINAGAQKVVKGEVDWTEVGVSGVSDAISGGLGSALPNTKLGQKLMDAGKSAKEKVGNAISSVGNGIKKQADNVKKQIDNIFSPKLATAGGIDNFDNSLKNVNLPKTEVQKNYNAIMNESKVKPNVDVNPKVKADVNPNRARAEMLKEKYSYMTPDECSARLQQLAEENAYRRLQEMENSIPGAHFLEKHGAHTSLQSQLDRVQFGMNPTTKLVETWPNGNIKYPSSGTRFLSYRDQLNAIQRAQQILKNTGNKTLAESPINFNYIIGSGYKRNPLQYGESYSAQVWFNSSSQPITAFPKWGE